MRQSNLTHNPCSCTHGNYKLHLEDVIEIRKLSRTGAWSPETIAKAFKISRCHVSNLKHGRF